MLALHWVKGQSSCWKPFVANRVAEIQSTWDPECCRYCTSRENPANLLTRRLSCGDMIASTLRWNGPRWLSSSDKHLPVRFGPKVELFPLKYAKRKGKLLMVVQQSLESC